MLAALLGGHVQLGVVALDPEDELAFLGLAGRDRQAAALELRERPFPGIEPQAGLAGLVVGTMAGEAVVREDRPDVACEIDRAFLGDGLGAFASPAARTGCADPDNQ